MRRMREFTIGEHRSLFHGSGFDFVGLPVAQADEVEAGSVKEAPVLADGELAHAAHDQELDLGELRKVHERLDVLLARPHGMATLSITSLITESVVRPWL